MRRFITRREALSWLGGAVAAGCGTSSGPAGTVSAPDGGVDPKPDSTTTPLVDAAPPIDPVDAGAETDSADGALPSTPEQLLAGIESIIVLMMENRSFDHFLGSLKTDAVFSNASSVEGLAGTESNPAPEGGTVPVFKLTNFTVADPSHGWDASHTQWDNGANDGFVKAHEGLNQNDVMGYHDRSQLPFYYWLADNFTVCDHWFASVMGPTWPNRFYLHACTSYGKKDNSPFITGAPPTLWKQCKAANLTFKNYTAGPIAWYTGGFAGEVLNLNPVRQISEFFDDAQQGKLPNFAIIDPDFTSADDHPAHDIKKGQVFAASIYRAIAESPQWERTLLVIIYDEHGGFFDHVPPPKTVDANPEFEQLGFRIPAFVIGGRVKRGHVEKTTYEHCSIGATLKARYGIGSLNARMDAAASLAACIDPVLIDQPASPPPNMPVPQLHLGQALADRIGETSQPSLDTTVQEGLAKGLITEAMIDRRPHEARVSEWLRHAERVGAVKLVR
jgi:phospholipase C